MLQAIGIDFGGTTIKSGVVQDGQILAHGEVIDTQHYPTCDSLIEAMVSMVGGLRHSFPAVVGIGIGLPGLIDSVNGVVHELTNVAGWNDVQLRARLREKTGLPVTIENDANAMAYGEFKFGNARDARHVICITLGTGVGGALILDGKLYRGAQLGAGEIGHLSIDYRGRPGPYGNYGGLEEYVGNQQIAERAAECYRQAGQNRSPMECSPMALAQNAAAGDGVARQLWADVGDEIGAALANVVWVLNPDAIIIGGGVAKAGPLIFDPIRRSLEQRTAEVFHRNLRILPAVLSNDAGTIGSAVLAQEFAAHERSTVL